MKTLVSCLILFILLSGCAHDNTSIDYLPDTLRIVTTTSVNDSGLLEYLRPYLLEEAKIAIDVVSLGSGAALEAGKRGDADVLLVHSPKDEMTFIKDGYGLKRSLLMYNFFVIVGPNTDLSAIKGLSASAAFTALSNLKQPFISRGDNSGTHAKEKQLWTLAGIQIEALAKNNQSYVSAGLGMANTLLMASELQAYTLTDLATYLSLKDRLNLEVLVSQSDELRNDYSIIRINPDKVKQVNDDVAERFEAWMLQPSTQQLIQSFGVERYGEVLFIPYE